MYLSRFRATYTTTVSDVNFSGFLRPGYDIFAYDLCALCSEPGSAGGLWSTRMTSRIGSAAWCIRSAMPFLHWAATTLLSGFLTAITHLVRRAPTLSAPA